MRFSRYNASAVHTDRLHDVSDLVATFTYYQLSGVQGFLIVIASKGICG
jgi:hypothetical protein